MVVGRFLNPLVIINISLIDIFCVKFKRNKLCNNDDMNHGAADVSIKGGVERKKDKRG